MCLAGDAGHVKNSTRTTTKRRYNWREQFSLNMIPVTGGLTHIQQHNMGKEGGGGRQHGRQVRRFAQTQLPSIETGAGRALLSAPINDAHA